MTGSPLCMQDLVMRNPPYQDDRKGTSTTALPVYHDFMDAAESVADAVELITPARFLFNAGRTPKKWNEKKLNDPHFKVLEYYNDGTSVFPNTDIKGGVAISYRDKNQNYGKIGKFTIYSELNSLIRKIESQVEKDNLSNRVFVASKFNTNSLFKAYPKYMGHERRLSSNVLQFDCFHDEKEEEDIEIFGIFNGSRKTRFINQKFIDLNDVNIPGYKVVLPKADGNGTYGDTLTKPEILNPNSGFTHSFLGMGSFNSKYEAESERKYIKTKFVRALLGVLKVTQDNNADKWALVPNQDFSLNSDLDWDRTIAEIDQQLYKKYGLSSEEISFIEANVKEME